MIDKTKQCVVNKNHVARSKFEVIFRTLNQRNVCVRNITLSCMMGLINDLALIIIILAHHKAQNRRAALGRPAIKLLGGGLN